MLEIVIAIVVLVVGAVVAVDVVPHCWPVGRPAVHHQLLRDCSSRAAGVAGLAETSFRFRSGPTNRRLAPVLAPEDGLRLEVRLRHWSAGRTRKRAPLEGRAAPPAD